MIDPYLQDHAGTRLGGTAGVSSARVVPVPPMVSPPERCAGDAFRVDARLLIGCDPRGARVAVAPAAGGSGYAWTLAT